MRGRLFFNGNVRAENDLVMAARPLLLDSRHRDPEIAESRKVLLITAAWGEDEHREGHIKKALSQIGIPNRFQNGFDRNQENLSAYHLYQEFCRFEPKLASQWEERDELIRESREIYLQKNTFFISQLRRAMDELHRRTPGRNLARAMAEPTRRFTHAPAHFDGDRLLGFFLEQDLRDTLQRLIDNDERMVNLLHELDEQFVDGTGLHLNDTWLRLRQELSERILSANSILIFGGHFRNLHRSLNFFRLRESLIEALRRGTSFYTVSAGSLMLCERVIIYDDFEDGREFQLYDRGFGLVRHLQIFPHCMDRIQTDNPDNLAYLAYRFQNRTCVGLNEDSFLLMEASPELRCTSVGDGDGVYVFNSRGEKHRYDQGEQIPL